MFSDISELWNVYKTWVMSAVLKMEMQEGNVFN